MLRERTCRTVVAVCGILFLVLWFWNPTFSKDSLVQELLRPMLSRALGAVIFGALLLFIGNRVWCRLQWRHLTVFLPALLIAVNNFPFIALFSGAATLTRSELLPLLILDCLLIGIFEEFAFRGTLFLGILSKHRKTKRQIILTTVICSAAFGLVHFANLLEGAGVGPTLLQVGYSFLIGGMCSIVLLRTGNLFYCVILHAVYDFGGRILLIGEGARWDTVTVVLTVVLSVLVTAWMLWMLLCTMPEDANHFFQKKKGESADEHDKN